MAEPVLDLLEKARRGIHTLSGGDIAQIEAAVSEARHLLRRARQARGVYAYDTIRIRIDRLLIEIEGPKG